MVIIIEYFISAGWTILDILLGRRGSTTASISEANSDLPSLFSNLSGLITAFSNKGFTTAKMVALSGNSCYKSNDSINKR